MERGTATRGQTARQVAGAESIEIKATIPQAQVDLALARYRLTPRSKEQRYIYFFDTPSLDLLDLGIIVRARRVVGGEHDSTIKFRPVKPGAVRQKWRKHRGFKIESDASEKGFVTSASFTAPVAKGLIKRVAAGDAPIERLFAGKQQDFLGEMSKRHLDLSTLVVMGPLWAHRWEFVDPACPWPMTAELWRRDDGKTLLEASIKVPAIQAAAAIGGFLAFLAEVGAERDQVQQAKTRWALDYHAAKYRTSTSRAANGGQEGAVPR